MQRNLYSKIIDLEGAKNSPNNYAKKNIWKNNPKLAKISYFVKQQFSGRKTQSFYLF